ncbi:hypothetical protein [Hansschlegelia sp.]|uniref:hypothetical protein n=1 Tax=Hansschlegelia sp. TaxID=2041892 RepID=UPI002C3F7560|nr:hypothetical protein [Hansschlegelia sp.]HVI30179.1 hypothetical protein [Hansschlegelia sp.]
MRDALAVFETSVGEAKHLTSLYEYLSAQVRVPYPFEDLLRAQVVYAVGAFDKLMHDIIRIGMLEIFTGVRQPTPKYLAETISLEFHGSLVAATVAPAIPPKELLFERQVATKLGYISFQQPDNVASGLALIWPEQHKWAAIAAAMGLPAGTVATKLKLIATRRNAIVHESDMDPLSNTKSELTKAESADITDFILLCGRSIVGLVA